MGRFNESFLITCSSGTQSTWSESWNSSEFITTKIAFTSRSAAALREKIWRTAAHPCRPGLLRLAAPLPRSVPDANRSVITNSPSTGNQPTARGVCTVSNSPSSLDTATSDGASHWMVFSGSSPITAGGSASALSLSKPAQLQSRYGPPDCSGPPVHALASGGIGMSAKRAGCSRPLHASSF